MIEKYSDIVEQILNFFFKIFIPSFVAISIKIATQVKKEKLTFMRVIMSFIIGIGCAYFIFPFEELGDQVQGGIFELPIPRFSTGVMRGRFNPGDEQLYLCGLSAWGSTQPQLGGLYRIRKVDQPMHIPIGIKASTQGIELSFTDELDQVSVSQIANYTIKTWDLLRSRKYGSKHYNDQILTVTKAELGKDKKSIQLTIPDIKPTWGMEIQYRIKDDDGKDLEGLIQNTIHQLGDGHLVLK